MGLNRLGSWMPPPGRDATVPRGASALRYVSPAWFCPAVRPARRAWARDGHVRPVTRAVTRVLVARAARDNVGQVWVNAGWSCNHGGFAASGR